MSLKTFFKAENMGLKFLALLLAVLLWLYVAVIESGRFSLLSLGGK